MAKNKGRKLRQDRNLYSSDRPISSRKDDVLQRGKFAERLAKDIASWKGDDSLVVGVYGGWGGGKSSLKNLVLEELEKGRGSGIPVMEFNPWQFSGSGDIPSSFFRELEVVLGHQKPAIDVEKRAAKLKSYSRLLTLASSVTKAFGWIKATQGDPDASIVGATGNGLAEMALIAERGSEALEAKGSAEEKSLHQIRIELDALMGRLPHSILVVIDDIDRLTTTEILQVFQLVKANADFPRLVFLLLFERNIVARALDKISDGSGNEYLEKIVQVGYHIPHISTSSLRKVLFDGLDTVLLDQRVAKHWNRDRWNSLYLDGVSGFFRNLRHVKRFLASFAFHVSGHRGSKSFEVSPVDLVGLEALRVFEPAVYERMPFMKSVLTRHAGPQIFGEIKQEVIDSAISNLIAIGSSENRESIQSVLKILFPPISPAYGEKNGVSGKHQEWLLDLRVCHPDLFDKYFTMSVADDDISQGELEKLLNSVSDRNKFLATAEGLKQRGVFKLAFERLDAYKEKIPVMSVPEMLHGLCDLTDSVPEPFGELFEIDFCTYAWRLSYYGLLQESNQARRFEILRDAFTKSTGVALPMELTLLELDRTAERESVGPFLVEKAQAELLKEICVTKTREMVKNGRILDSPRIRMILLRWCIWDSNATVLEIMKHRVRTSEEVLVLLGAFLGESHSYGPEHKVRYSMQLKLIERFLDIDVVTDLTAKLKPHELDSRHGLALKEFRKALQRRSDGKPDNIADKWGDFEDLDQE